VIINNLRC